MSNQRLLVHTSSTEVNLLFYSSTKYLFIAERRKGTKKESKTRKE